MVWQFDSAPAHRNGMTLLSIPFFVPGDEKSSIYNTQSPSELSLPRSISIWLLLRARLVLPHDEIGIFKLVSQEYNHP